MPITTKTVNNERYIYFSCYIDGKKREVYCGLASNVRSKKKALHLELERIREQKNNLSQKVTEIESKIKML